MSVFDVLKNAIFRHASVPAPKPSAAPAATPKAPASPPASQSSTAPVPPKPAATSTAPAAGASTAPVDIEATLERLNAQQPQKLNWQTSIVDLMKLVGIDPSLEHRKELARELGYKGDPHDSAAMNVWLHQEVMKKLAATGGKVPASLQ